MRFPGRILVADHSGNLDRFVCRVLGEDRWYIASADNIYDLEKAIYSQVPHILIINAHLPNLRIKALVEQIRQHYGDNRPHIIVAVVKDVERRLKKAFAAGVDDFLRVPFHAVELAAKINCAMRTVHLRADFQHMVDEYNHQLATQAATTNPEAEQPLERFTADEVLTSLPTAHAIPSELHVPEKREFPDPEQDLDSTVLVKNRMEAPFTHQQNVPSPAALSTPASTPISSSAPPPPPTAGNTQRPASRWKSPSNLANVIPIFPPPAGADENNKTTVSFNEPPAIDPVAFDLGFAGSKMGRDAPQRLPPKPQANPELSKTDKSAARQSSSTRKTMTMMLVKVNAFATVCEDLEETASSHIIENVYQDLVKEVERFGGQAMSIQGDSLLLAFTSAKGRSNHRLNAVQAALKLQIKAMFLDEDYPDLMGQIDLSIAIHTGTATNTVIEHDQTIQTSLVGSSVTILSDLLDSCADGQIIISETTYGSLRDTALLQEEKTISVGRGDRSITVATLNGMKSTTFALAGNMRFD